MYKGLCRNYLDGGVGIPDGGKGKNHNLAQREVACTISVIGGAQASFELFERTVELSCGK